MPPVAGHGVIDTDHLLVAIMHQEASIGSAVLLDLAISRKRAELAMQQLHPSLDAPPDPPEQSTALGKALELAVDESRWLGQHYIGTEHLLLGIVRGGGGQAPELMRALGINAEQVRRRARRMIQLGVTEIDMDAARMMARLSELSRRTLTAAEQVAARNGHAEVTVAHLLLVLSQEQRSVCSRILRECGFHPDELEASFQKENPTTGGSVDAIVNMAVDEADRLGSLYTGTDHMLLSICLHPRGARLLRMYGAQPDAVERRIRDALQR
ncbi:MAG: hypothetical protein M5R40_14915 [Anaerolineae bacterium]|nr:hypothetical protein [Anaerolineae bacterium]